MTGATAVHRLMIKSCISFIGLVISTAVLAQGSVSPSEGPADVMDNARADDRLELVIRLEDGGLRRRMQAEIDKLTGKAGTAEAQRELRRAEILKRYTKSFNEIKGRFLIDHPDLIVDGIGLAYSADVVATCPEGALQRLKADVRVLSIHANKKIQIGAVSR